MRLAVVVGALAGVLLMPSVANARPGRPSQSVECVCMTFARYMDGSAALRRKWTRFVDSSKGLRGNRQAGDAIKVRIKVLAQDGKEKSQEGCKANEFMRRVCNAFKACVAAAGGTLYLEWVQGGKDFWAAEKDAVDACTVALAATYFLS